MNVGQIKINTLNLMFTGYEKINEENLDQLLFDENYSSYLYRMEDAIDRCLSIIESKCILDTKQVYLEDLEKVEELYKIDLTDIQDYYQLEKISLIQGIKFTDRINYHRVGKNIFIKGNRCILSYYPKVERLREVKSRVDNINEYVIPIRENILELIPYFLKGELYREDEPNEASESMNWFEQRLLEMKDELYDYQSRIEDVYES